MVVILLCISLFTTVFGVSVVANNLKLKAINSKLSVEKKNLEMELANYYKDEKDCAGNIKENNKDKIENMIPLEYASSKNNDIVCQQKKSNVKKDTIRKK